MRTLNDLWLEYKDRLESQSKTEINDLQLGIIKSTFVSTMALAMTLINDIVSDPENAAQNIQNIYNEANELIKKGQNHG